MCGILGVIGPRQFGREAFGAALDSMASRGPDDRGIYEEPECLLGHRRLAILDLSAAGHQPMSTPDGRYHIIYNGEVYNYTHHRKDLEAAGVVFCSTSDTEVLLHLYAQEGPAFLEKLRGKFALAIWDAREKSLFLARDRLGVKPLYYWSFPGGLAFASEVRALRYLPSGPRDVAPAAVAQYLLWGSVAEPLTLLDGVHSLAPATWVTWKGGEFSRQQYWSLPGTHPEESAGRPFRFNRFGEAVEALRPVLREAVALRCVSDAPLGAFLSGGIDSSAVVSLMRAVGQTDIRTLAVSFPGTAWDESRYALRVAEALETHHSHIPLTEDLVSGELDGFFSSMDQPTCDGVNVYMVSKFARQIGLAVALSGTGGDEAFAGYGHFRRSLRLAPWLKAFPPLGSAAAWWGRRIPLSKFAKLEALGGVDSLTDHLYRLARGLFMPGQVRRLLSPAALEAVGPVFEAPASRNTNGPLLQALRFRELHGYMLNQLLRDTDVFGMAHSVEVRVPLLDHRVMETVFDTAPAILLGRDSEAAKHGAQKALLLSALPQPLPRECTHRPKMGFTFPFDVWMRGPWRGTIEEGLNSSPAGSLLNPNVVREVWEAFLEGRLHWSRAWSLFVLRRIGL